MGKGYHNSILAAEKSKSIEEGEDIQGPYQEAFTDLAAIAEEPCDINWGLSHEELNSCVNDLSDSCASTSKPFDSPFKSYTLNTSYDVSSVASSKSTRATETKTVTFSKEADQVLHLSPVGSVTSSPSMSTISQLVPRDTSIARRQRKTRASTTIKSGGERGQKYTFEETEASPEYSIGGPSVEKNRIQHLSEQTQEDSSLKDVDCVQEVESTKGFEEYNQS